MARKVFISVLGASFYKMCQYGNADEGEFRSLPTRFIQQATLEKVTKDAEWTSTDCGYVFLTKRAFTENWHVKGNKRYNRSIDKEEEYIGLEDVISGMHLAFAVEGVDIPDGGSEEEIWQIFDIVYSKLQEGDELYFDVTHGFRYLPMLVLVLCNYAKFLKGITVKSVTYGNFETKDPETNIAPIIDITSFSTLQDWTQASAEYLRHGDSNSLKECASQQLRPILSAAKGKDEAANALRALITSLYGFTDSLRSCRGMDIISGNQALSVASGVDRVGTEYLKPFLPLLGKIRESVAEFRKDCTLNQLLAAKLCFEQGNLQPAATLLKEGIVSYFCARHELEVNNNHLRELVDKAFIKALKRQKGKLAEYNPSSVADEEIISRIEQDELFTVELVNAFSNLVDVRNDINHAGMRCFKAPLKVKNMKTNIEKELHTALSTFIGNSSKEAEKPLPPLFLNLSNHPSSSWTAEQLAAAREFGEVVDMSFPQVAPDATEEGIGKLADEQVALIREYAREHDVTVHVMGEMSLTYRLVSRLTALGIRCVCSTSYRIVKDEGNGKRLVEFHFNKFRSYEQ